MLSNVTVYIYIYIYAIYICNIYIYAIYIIRTLFAENMYYASLMRPLLKKKICTAASLMRTFLPKNIKLVLW